MNLPSLYFWLFSYACSYFQPEQLHVVARMLEWWQSLAILNKPRVVLQQSQKMSATAWRPVSRTLLFYRISWKIPSLLIILILEVTIK